MTPSIHLDAPPKPETEPVSNANILVSPEPTSTALKDFNKGKPRAVGELFHSSMIENNRIKSRSNTVDFLVALMLNSAILAGPILAGLVYTDTFNLRQFESTFLIAPPPPPPAPAVAQMKAAPVHRVFENAGKLIAPTVVPKTIAEIKEAPLPPDFEGGGVTGRVLGGVAGGSMEG
jgi:hypothetical protein